MDIIDELRQALSDDADDNNNTDNNSGGENDGGLFSGLDPEMLLKMLTLFETLNQPNDNERFLLALKPVLREENRPKIDSAIRLLKLFSLLPVLKDSGLFDKLL